MAQFQNMIITRAGLDMIAQSQAGGTLIFTKGKFGDGQIGDQSIPDLTDLINAKMSVELSFVTAKTEGHVEVRFIVDNTDLDVGFFVREVGIFAKVNEEGVEQLYGYANAGNYTNYLADKSVPIDSIITKIDLVVGNASNIAFTTDKSIVYVTLEDLEEAIDTHNKDSNAHEPAFDAHNAADDAHKDFTGATAEAAGKRGMVPAPAVGAANRYLKADGTWGTIDTMNGASGSESGGEGLVPAPEAGAQNKFLRGDGTWADAKMSTKELVDILYPVGHIYMSTNSANPGTLFPGTTWEALPAGRVLLAQGTSEWGTEYAAGSTGGEATHTLTRTEMPSHNHSGSTNSTGAHTHGAAGNRGWDGTSKFGFSDQTTTTATLNTNSAGSHSHTVTIGNTGGGSAHNNMQPYLSVYMWKRTA